MANPELLLVGATGFIGRALLPVLIRRHPVTAARFSSPVPDRASPWIRLPGDPERVREMVQDRSPAVIVNAAALASPAACARAPDLARRLNVDLPAALAASGARLIHLSTDQVFDGRKGDYRETDPPNPISLYGETKLAGERAVREQCEDSVVLRVNLVCGRSTGPRPSSVDAMLAAADAGEEIPLFTDEVRSPVAVTDVARAVAKLAGSEFRGTLHLGGPRLSRWELGLPILEKHGRADRAQPASLRDYEGPPRAPDTSFCTERARDVLGFEPGGLDAILADC